MSTKYVYSFGPWGADGDASMKNSLGGKGANLAEMCRLKLPVPAGFTISTEFCTVYLQGGKKFPDALKEEVAKALCKTEEAMGKKYGDAENPLLMSCRSGARKSMPGMMETVLNVGLCPATIPGLVKKSGSERFVWDAYRRLIMMYSDVVMEKAEDIEPADGHGIRHQLEGVMAALKKQKKYKSDTDMKAEDLKKLCDDFKAKVLEVLGKPFPDDPQEQLWGAVGAVFKSWQGRRAVSYRRIEGIPEEWGTACNVQSMVFGNMGDDSATGVAFSRNPATGENKFYGEWLVNAQGEDVVAGIRTPSPINEATKNEQNKHLSSLETAMPGLYKELYDIRTKLEHHYHDMQDIEFTIESQKLYMLQCRNGKRTGTAALNMAMDMLHEKLIDEVTAVTRVEPAQLDELLHPIIDPAAEKTAETILSGLPAGPGGACGKIVFTSADAVDAAAKGEKVILVREETNPEDVEGMRAAEGILTARGGMTSHAALVARGWGKCCIVGAGELKINFAAKTAAFGKVKLKKGDLITLNGTKGRVYQDALAMIDATENPRFQEFMKIVDKHRTMGVRTNADTPEDAKVARLYGAEGIGLFRTEHMFYGKGSDEPLFVLRKMIFEQHPGRAAGRRQRVVPLCQEEHQGHAGSDERPAGHDPPLGSAAARVRAAGQGRRGPVGRGPQNQAGRHQEARRGPARGQSHDGPPRHPPGDHLSRGDRDADQGDPRIGRRTDQGRQGRQAGDHGPRDLQRQGDRRHQGPGRSRACRGEGGHRSGREVSLRHHDRDSAGLLASRSDGEEGTVLLLRHQRPHADDVRLQPRRHRRFPARVPQGWHPRGRSLPDDRPAGRGPVDQDGGGEGPGHEARSEGRHLRRAGRRSGLRRVLFQDGAELRQLFALPRADRPPGGGPRGHQGQGQVGLPILC